MRIARYSVNGSNERLGVVDGDEIADIFADLPNLSPELGDWLPAGSASWRFFAALAEKAPRHSLDAVLLHAPVRPSKLLGIGANYACHIEEVARIGVKAPPHQLWFNKQVSSLNGPYGEVVIPTISEQVDYEGELAVVIGRRARNVDEQHALDHVAGYMICNDVSVRDVQFRSPTHTLGKSFDTHAPVGPWLVTADEIPDPQALRIRTWVNNEIRQDASTATMVYSVASQIAELSSIMTLYPGDVLATGTPAGVAIGSQPPRWIKPGDIVRVEVDGIGAIENRFVQSAS